MQEFFLWVGIVAVVTHLAVCFMAENPITTRSSLRWATGAAIGVTYLLCSAAWNNEPIGRSLSICATLVIVFTAVVLMYHLFCWMNVFPHEQNTN